MLPDHSLEAELPLTPVDVNAKEQSFEYVIYSIAGRNTLDGSFTSGFASVLNQYRSSLSGNLIILVLSIL